MTLLHYQQVRLYMWSVYVRHTTTETLLDWTEIWRIRREEDQVTTYPPHQQLPLQEPRYYIPAASTSSRSASLLCIEQLSITRTLHGSGYGFIFGTYYMVTQISKSCGTRENIVGFTYYIVNHEIKEFTPINRTLNDTNCHIAIYCECWENTIANTPLKGGPC